MELFRASIVRVDMQPDWREWLLDLLFPQVCAGCLLDIPPPLSGPLCGACFKQIRRLEDPLCLKCGIPLDWAPGHRKRCPEPLISLDRIRAAFPYKYPFPTLIHAFKYRSRHDIGKALGGWMAGAFFTLWGSPNTDWVAPIPLHPARLRQRGFNQAAILAQAIAQTSGIRMLEGLERTRNTRPQWKLNREQRLKNLHDVFQYKGKSRIQGKKILLIDDVCTTGGTLEACAKSLKKAGASAVEAFVLARD